MPRGGRRPNSGRKSNNRINALRQIINSKYTDADWLAVSDQLFEQARQGNLKAVHLLFSYCFGEPTNAPGTDDKPPVRVIEFIDPARLEPPPDS